MILVLNLLFAICTRIDSSFIYAASMKLSNELLLAMSLMYKAKICFNYNAKLIS